MGQWIRRPLPHVCALPLFGTLFARVGDEWRCDCGKTYVVQVSVDGVKKLVERSRLTLWLADQAALRDELLEREITARLPDLSVEERREHYRAWIQRLADRERATVRRYIEDCADNVRADLGLPKEHSL